jgi:hypothetical protein
MPEPFPLWKIVVQLVVVVGLLLFWTVRPDPLRQMLQLGIVAEVLYGMLQDQVSVRLCKEYFTLGHPPIPGVEDPTLLGLLWGFLGAWWGGALLGALAGFSARLGSAPKLDVRALFLPVGLLLLAQAGVTFTWGWLAARQVDQPGFQLGEPWLSGIPAEQHARFYLVACMHQGTYLSAAVGGVLVCLWLGWQRWRLGRRSSTR